MDRPQVGVGVFIVRDGKILLHKRRNAHGAGSWSIPGGHLEGGESIEACARREVLEETGMRITGVRHVAFTNDIFTKEGKHYITLFVVADNAEGEPQVMEPEKCERWAWFSWDAMPQPLFLPIQNLQKQQEFLDRMQQLVMTAIAPGKSACRE